MLAPEELTEIKLLRDTRESVKEILICLKGLSPNGEDGLIHAVQEIKVSVKEQNGKVSKLSKRVWFLFGLLASSGTGVGIWSLLTGG